MLVDRASIEIYGNEGRVYMPMGAIAKENAPTRLCARGCDIWINALEVNHLKSIWE